MNDTRLILHSGYLEYALSIRLNLILHFSMEMTTNASSKVDEAYVLINAIKNANLPKFISDDVTLFEQILADIFPDAVPPSTDHVALEVSCLYFHLSLSLSLFISLQHSIYSYVSTFSLQYFPHLFLCYIPFVFDFVHSFSFPFKMRAFAFVMILLFA